MVVATLPETKPEVADVPSPEALEQYRQHVFSAVENGMPMQAATLDAAWKLQTDFESDCRTYERRLAARRVLDIDGPELHRQADALDEEARQIAAVATVPVKDSPLIQEYEDRTLGELWAAIQPSILAATPGYRLPQALKARELRNDASSNAGQAKMLLERTADPTIARQISDLMAEAQSVRGSIEKRTAILDIEDRVRAQHGVVEWLAAGKLPPGWTPRGDRSIRSLYVAERRKLNELRRLALQKGAAEQANQRDQATLAALNRKIAELVAQRQEARRMVWHS